ncbi:MAG: FAD-dependent oxidoreductase [Oscillospiraceae bacterium]|nr:FAD-dependent oxidoreductase [Oscillospiraceae bacterium]
MDVYKTLYCDVAVIGGGTGGCAAAIEAARKGMHTILFEKGTTLGGLATNGYVPQIAGGIEGICLEFAERLDKIGQLRKIDPSKNYYRNPSFEPEYGKIVLEDMLFEAGSRIIYDSTFINVEMDGANISCIYFYTKGGLLRVKAKIYIDATGDGDVSAVAGVPFEVGGQDFAGLNQSTTQGSRWAGANLPKYLAAAAAYKEEQIAQGNANPLPYVYVLEQEAIDRGEMTRHVCNRHGDFFRVLIPNTPPENASFVTFSFHSYYCHNTDPEDLTRQILEQHQLMKQFHAFLKNHVPGFENLRLVGMGSVPGVRDSRRIFGEYMLKSSDVCCGTKFEDGIARFPEMFDAHHPTSDYWVFQRHMHIPAPQGSAVMEEEHEGICCTANMHPFGIPGGLPARSNPRDYCEIPYRCLLPIGVDNLLAAGRCCSSEFHANGAMRIIGPAMGTGHAAGLAAALAVEEKLRPRDIPGTRVRELLIAEGVQLDKPCDGYWAEMAAMEGELVVTKGDFAAIRPTKKTDMKDRMNIADV